MPKVVWFEKGVFEPPPACKTHIAPFRGCLFLCWKGVRLQVQGDWPEQWLGDRGQNRWHRTSAGGKGQRPPGRPRASWTTHVSCPLTVATLLTADQPVPRDHSLRATDTAEEFLPGEGSYEGTQCQGTCPSAPSLPQARFLSSMGSHSQASRISPGLMSFHRTRNWESSSNWTRHTSRALSTWNG